MTTTLSAPVDLEAKRWKKRLFVIYAPPDTPAAIKRQIRVWDEEENELDARDLEVVSFDNIDDQPEISRRYRITPGRFTALLIGKDGAERLRSREPLSPRRLYAEIDSTPLRQEELKRR
ncbi:MAG: DUF4174 domain-containing protein [Chthoniobacteraceae bacterium]